MKILLAFDSFKGSLEASNVCQIVSNILKEEFDVVEYPMADGGEGTVNAIVKAREGKFINVRTLDHIGRELDATYGIFENNAVIEAASVCGLYLVPSEERNIMHSNSYGLGKLILSAIELGVDNFMFAIGGTGTNDGGYGLARALGYRFLDENGADLSSAPESLINLSKIIPPLTDLKKYKFTVACDVENTLCGETGASFTYGYQKGGTQQQLEHLDKCLEKLAKVIESDLGVNVLSIKGGGAGGGLAAGLVAFCGGKLESGYSLVKDATNIEDIIKDVDVVVTGEGKTDMQTLYGKLPYGILLTAKKYNKKVVLLSGCITQAGKNGMEKFGCDAFFSCVGEDTPKEHVITNAQSNLEMATNDLKVWLRSL